MSEANSDKLPEIPMFRYDKAQRLLVSDRPEIVVKHFHVGGELVDGDRQCGFRLMWGPREIYFRANQRNVQAGKGKPVASTWTIDRVGMAWGATMPYQFKSNDEFKTAVLIAMSALRAYSNPVIEGSSVTDVLLKPSLAERMEEF